MCWGPHIKIPKQASHNNLSYKNIMALIKSTQFKKLAPSALGSTHQNLKSSKPQEFLLCGYYGFSKLTQNKKLVPNSLWFTYQNSKSSKPLLNSLADPLPADPLPADPLKCLLCEYYGFSKVNSEQETCQKYFVVHISKFQIKNTAIIYPTRISWL